MSIWRGRGLGGGFVVLGTRIPAVTGGLIALTLAVSVAGAVADQAGASVREWLVLVPGRVWQGELWRLLSWVFVEIHPLSLIFGCLVLWMFGGELNNAWGPRRFIRLYVGFAVSAGILTCLIARLAWPTLLAVPYATMWPIMETLLIAWAVLYPHRQILFYFVLPVGGRALIWLTVGGTVLFLYLRPVGPRYLWLRFKYAMATRRRPRLKTVERPDRQEPPRWLH
jgi:membrane associated rhomboid family serine protease